MNKKNRGFPKVPPVFDIFLDSFTNGANKLFVSINCDTGLPNFLLKISSPYVFKIDRYIAAWIVLAHSAMVGPLNHALIASLGRTLSFIANILYAVFDSQYLGFGGRNILSSTDLICFE